MAHARDDVRDLRPAIDTALLVTGYELPDWIAGTIGLLGALMIPLMLLALGNTLGDLRLARLPFASFWGLVRLAVGLAVAIGVAFALELEGVARGVLILQGAMFPGSTARTCSTASGSKD
ncbi:MAG TPA: hypothetical protein VMR74_16085 [Gammaproteobacteria bacterium]|nr:hypothetical protein [Gammaproteobacteria bacterium]